MQDSKGADQTAQLRGLIWAVTVHCQNHLIRTIEGVNGEQRPR